MEIWYNKAVRLKKHVKTRKGRNGGKLNVTDKTTKSAKMVNAGKQQM